MKLLLYTVFLSIAGLTATTVIASDAVPTDALYVLNIWESPGGLGYAIAVGPMKAGCDTLRQKIAATPDLPIPPDMQLTISTCVRKPAMSMYLMPRNCVATDWRAVPNATVSRSWLYSCFRR